MVFSKIEKMMWVPPPAFHGTISLAVLQANFGAATDGVGANARAPRVTATTAPHISNFFMEGLPCFPSRFGPIWPDLAAVAGPPD